jgi:hypothetical protein
MSKVIQDKVSNSNVYEQRFRMLMKLIRLNKMVIKAEIKHKKLDA